MRRLAASISRSAVALVAVVVLLSTGLHAEEVAAPEEPKGYFIEGSRFLVAGAQLFDVVLLRPIAVINTGVGAALFVPAALLSLGEGKDGTAEAWEHFVETPAKSVYERPLGDF